ncbi:hypothetical protein NAEGRDRAFT_62424 [Naegleria gruberi]|uniref:Uncharacterized protein n=1 Tax=Naegleria gruberi TaxID=5762 RepID=D2V0V0_NAEGR|nr:uncharacterized protein NAEGRDRAFT_62424 [Naegleria gruberi]EFC49577.1 hypothetical protein NAEGRDRAFT_62424 [Naegleria gruberi]|eukprot:XP_002682321.1 hypothetical protein NAEGRDRAFT_62424 [Naegleria gruberi strain NEG-M]
MTTIALRNFNPKISVYAQINLIESKNLIQKAGARVIVCYESICSKVMSACSTAPVFSCFLYNLLSGADVDIEHDKLKDYVFSENLSEQENDINWIIEYSDGMNNELYRAKFSPVFYGSLFIDVAELLRRSDITIFALESNHTIHINPSGHRIKEGDRCYCIAPSIEYAELVEKFKISAAELSKFKSGKEEEEIIEYNQTEENNEEAEVFEQEFTEYLKPASSSNSSSNQQQKKVDNEKWVLRSPRLRVTPRLRINQLLRMRTETNVDISLLRDEDDDHNTHLEILLKLISPESYFQEKRKYLQSIRNTFTGSELAEKEKEFYSKITQIYNMVDRPFSKDEIFIQHHKDKNISDHLIILGDFSQPAIVCALSRSLQRHSRDTQIVLMTDKTDYLDLIYQRLRYFNKVYIILGNYLKTTHLRRAGFGVCKRILFFATEDKDNEIINEYTIDSEAIKLSLGISVMDKSKGYVIGKFIIHFHCSSKEFIELVNRANMKFFQHQGIPTHLKVKKMREDGLLDYDIDEFDQFCLFSDYYISGRVFPSSSFLSKLLSQSFHNRKIVDLIEQLCSDEFTSGDHQSVVIEVPLPSVFVGKSVLQLVTSCYQHNLILLALSRVKTNNPSDRYVYTNPSLSKTLVQTDLVFLCGHRNNIKSLVATRGSMDRFFTRSWTSNNLFSSPISDSSDDEGNDNIQVERFKSEQEITIQQEEV